MGRPASGKLLAVFLSVLAVLGASGGCAARRSGAAAQCDESLKGSAIGDLTATGLDGRPVRLRDVAGGQVALVDFWATWCGPCLEAIPHLQELHTRYHSRGFTVIGVLIDGNATRIGPAFVQDKKLTYPNVMDDDAAATDKAMCSVSGVPLLMLIDRQGKVVDVFDGGIDHAAIDQEVARLVGAPAA